MSGDRTFFAIACSLAIYAGPASAADEAPQDAEFLEYLGMWDESDEDWMIFEQAMDESEEKKSDPVPENEESMEEHDEG